MGLENIFRVTKTESALRRDVGVNPHFDVLAHRVEFPATGAPPATFYTINHKFFASSVVCISEDDQVLLSHNPRFALRDVAGDEYSWELPGGRNRGGETPLECAKREFLEETGFEASNWEPLLKDYYYPESSFGTEKLYLYQASTPRKVGDGIPETEGLLRTKWFPFSQAVRMAFDGRIRSSWTIIGILAAKLKRDGAYDAE